jgi:hypothetical protein
MLRRLSEEEYQSEARSALLKLCNTEYPEFDTPFSNQVERAIVLMDYWGVIEGHFLQPIIQAASKLGDQGFFLSVPYPQTINVNIDTYWRHWYVPFEDIREYEQITESSIYKHIHYSPQGAWGILSSDEPFGILGGPKGFIDEICRLAPEIEKGAYEFLDYMNWIVEIGPRDAPPVDVSWVRRLLVNIYGTERAEELLREVGWKY